MARREFDKLAVALRPRATWTDLVLSPRQLKALRQVASKYIGETEKNLELLFDRAKADDAILLFDEADALFGKRSEVKDSHDRYANIEVGYLLQRMESHGGIVILETTRRNAIDPALLRRSRHVVDFPQPGAVQRRALWEKAIPPAAAIQEPDLRKLARMEMSGGRISAIAVDAALRAADASLPVDMRMLMEALIRERRKRGITADDTDVR